MSDKTKGFIFLVAIFVLMLSGSNTILASGFSMEMDAGNSTGTTKRHINISSPFSGAYLYEDVKVVGQASITDSFRMDNFGHSESRTDSFDDWNFFDSPSGGNPQDLYNFDGSDQFNNGGQDIYDFEGEFKPSSTPATNSANSGFEGEGVLFIVSPFKTGQPVDELFLPDIPGWFELF